MCSEDVFIYKNDQFSECKYLIKRCVLKMYLFAKRSILRTWAFGEMFNSQNIDI